MLPINKKRRQLAERVAKLRRDMAITQADFAVLVKVKQNVISRWESGSAEPTGQGFVRLGNIASDYADKKWFWEQAGMDLNALDNFTDMRMSSKKAASASDFIEISALDPAIKETVPFPARLLKNRASTRFLRLRTTRKLFKIVDTEFGPGTAPFSAGDTLLIDPGKTDLRSIEQGALIAVRIKSRDGINYHEYAGTLNRVFVGDGSHYWLGMKERNVLIGYSSRRSPREADGPVVMVGADSRVLGCLVAWIKAEANE